MLGFGFASISVSFTIILLLGRSSFADPILAASSTDNQCTCTFTTPPVVVCTEYDANHVATLTGRQDNVQEHLDNVTSQLANYADEWSRANERIKEFDRQLSDLIVSCLRSPATPAGSAGNDVMVAGDNFMEEVRRQLLSLEDALATVKESHPDGDILEGIENQVENITTVVDALAGDMAGLVKADWQSKAATLTDELDQCRETPPDILPYLTTSQWPHRGNQDTTKRISKVLQPFTVRGATSLSTDVWFSDPTNEPGAIWSGQHVLSVCTARSTADCRYGSYMESRSTFNRYNTTQLFERSSGINHKTHYLPDQIPSHGTAVVAYDGYLYYARRSAGVLVKFDYHSNETIVTRKLHDDIGFGGVFAYSGGRDSSWDLEVDETGLWMIYSTYENHGFVMLSKLNTTSLEFERTWTGNFPKTKLGNCFVISGVLYCVSSHSSPAARINYYMDTTTGEEGFMSVPFNVKYGNLNSLKYNPYNQKLYAIDDGLAVVYDLIFG